MHINVEVLGYLGNIIFENTTLNFFHCKITSGKPYLKGEDIDKMTDDDYYEPRFIDLSMLDDINIIETDFITKAINKQYIKNKYH